MAATLRVSTTTIATSPSSSLLSPKLTSSSSSLSASPCFPQRSTFTISLRQTYQRLPVKTLTLAFSNSLFGGDFGENELPHESNSVLKEREEPQCPPGLRQYETMIVLRPDMSEDERLNLTEKYEELLVAGGAMYVEISNKGIIPLAYAIKKKNRAGESNTYLDGIYLLFTYFTKPDSMAVLETRLKADDEIIRSSSVKIKKRKYN
ncbi:hypothetical protein GIB67_033402 [Kingdonia uniflora]|uniref:30S ribosomal protein S6 alpha, chloroplastic n=1 Tax=Kingdonia uniflora TaxID=39325 RepID=A0A7J7LTR8_9MAGN|nr:hypothetical protein GIB67_033402 [Kingdonia uniflora]